MQKIPATEMIPVDISDLISNPSADKQTKTTSSNIAQGISQSHEMVDPSHHGWQSIHSDKHFKWFEEFRILNFVGGSPKNFSLPSSTMIVILSSSFVSSL